MMLWTFAIILPFACALAFRYIVSSPWHCRGMCCFNEASCAKLSVEGSYEPQFAAVVEALERSLTVGWDIGASMFVMVDGRPVIDVAGGFRDKQKSAPYDTSTINVVFSTGKVMEGIAIALLEDKGLLSIEDPVAKYWPEYGQNGKGDITIKDVLTHRSGSSYSFDRTPTLDTLQSHEKRDRFVASQTYLYPRGTVSYRMLASAFISDAICRRVDPQKRTLSTFIKEELFESLGEVFLSPPILGGEHEAQFSELYDPPIPTMLLGFLPQIFIPGIYSRLLPNGHYLKVGAKDEINFFKAAILKQKHEDGFSFWDQPNIPDTGDGAASWNNHTSFLSYEMMSSNSISNARAMAKVFDAFMNGHVVQKDTLRKFKEPLPVAYDRLLAKNLAYTSGGWSINPRNFIPTKAECQGWFGVGGAMLLHCNIGDHKVTFSYVMNAMAPTFRADRGVALLDKLTMLLSPE